jgi:hypothetical protein
VQTGCETNLNDPATCGTTCTNKVACSNVNATPGCVNGACKPTCSPGYGDCNAGSVNDGCEKQLNIANSCGTSCSTITTCTTPAQICASGTCAANTPYTIGQSSTSGWSAFDPPSETWFVVPVTPQKDVTLQEFRTIGVSDAGSARMALWADDGSGHPGAYLAQSGTFNVKTGVVGGAATPLAIVLTANKQYWVGAKFVNGPHLYQNNSAGAKGYTTSQAFGTAPSALSPFPSSPGTFTNTVLNFMLYVQDVPP